MAEKVYEIAPRAREAMTRAALRARNALQHGTEKNGIWIKITEQQARDMYWTEVREILKSAHIEVNPDSPIGIQCGNCKKVSMIARDVKTFRCECSPYEEQWVMKSRYFDGQTASRIIEMT